MGAAAARSSSAGLVQRAAILCGVLLGTVGAWTPEQVLAMTPEEFVGNFTVGMFEWCSLHPDTYDVFNISLVNQRNLKFTLDDTPLGFVSNVTALQQKCAQGEGCGLCADGMECRYYPQADDERSGFCVPCSLGQLCGPQSVNPLAMSRGNICPAGYYCPTPHDILPCPPGHFCPQGAVLPIRCNLTTPSSKLVFKLEGTYCPAFSYQPLTFCPCGYYCPNPAKLVVCPEGSFCPLLSVEPVACWPLSPCPAGSCAPSQSVFGYLFALAMFTLFGLVSYWLNRWWMGLQRARAEETVLSEKISAARNSILCNSAASESGASPSPSLSARSSGSGSGPSAPSPELRGFSQKRTPLRITFSDLNYRLNNGKPVLSGVNGTLRHSSLIAVMGPSGCGKTSLLNVLCAKVTSGVVSGEVRVNGRLVKPTVLKSVTGFVPQDDVVHTELTVLENLMFSARLRLGTKVAKEQQEQIVRTTVRILQLTHVQNSVVGSAEQRGVSGGQRKRVNVGLELVANPTLLFLDEPTSGLDSTSSESLLWCLKSMATMGMTVVAVIHQPRYSIFNMFDEVVLLGKGGRLAYLGPSTMAKGYFEDIGFRCPRNENPPDFFLDVLSGRTPNEEHPEANGEGLFSQWTAFLEGGGREQIHEARKHRACRAVANADSQVQRRKLVARAREAVARVAKAKAKGAAGRSYEAPSLGSAGSLTEPSNAPAADSVPCAQFAAVLRELGLHASDDEAAHLLRAVDPKGVGRVTCAALVRMLEEDWQPVGPVDAGEYFHDRPDELPVHLDEDEAHEVRREDLPALATPPLLSHILADPRAGSDMDSTSGMGPAVQRVQRLFITQFGVLLHRSLVKWMRAWRQRTVDLLLTMATAIILGNLQGNSWQVKEVAPNFLQTHLALAILTCTSALFPFRDRTIYWREAAAGVSRAAFFAAVTLMDLVDLAMRPAVFAMLYLPITTPYTVYRRFVGVLWSLVWAWSGVGYVLAHCMGRNATVAAVLLPLVFGGFLNGVNPKLADYEGNKFMMGLMGLSPNRWSVEANVLKELEAYPANMRIMGELLVRAIGYDPDNFWTDTVVLLVMGGVFRVLGFVAMCYCDRSKQV